MDTPEPVSGEEQAEKDEAFETEATSVLKPETTSSGTEKNVEGDVLPPGDKADWGEVLVPFAFKMELQIFESLQLDKVGVYPLITEGKTILQNNSPVFINTRSDLVRFGALTVYKAKLELPDGEEQKFSFKKSYTLTFVVPKTLDPKDLVAHLNTVSISGAKNVTYIYVQGTCKAQGGKNFFILIKKLWLVRWYFLSRR